jgi:hypothetical protein
MCFIGTGNHAALATIAIAQRIHGRCRKILGKQLTLRRAECQQNCSGQEKKSYHPGYVDQCGNLKTFPAKILSNFLSASDGIIILMALTG